MLRAGESIFELFNRLLDYAKLPREAHFAGAIEGCNEAFRFPLGKADYKVPAPGGPI